ncbi:INO80 complex subunit E-like isoform X2 [Littorina saxatilis]|uniref:INO80 complex subunit E-like isoform X2 n=1 Tax=Littorina saxatilis TaxID=31220 RepID=UPI0038B57F5A
MMPVPDSYPETDIDYKQKYKALKKRLKLLVYEQECFLEELRKAQRKLLKVAKDRSFLLDRLMQYEKVDDSSDDSDATASSDSDADGHHRDGVPAKRKRVSGHGGGGGHSQASASGEGGSQQATPANIASIILAQAAAGGSQEGGKKRAKPSSKKSKANASKAGSHATVASLLPSSTVPGQMTREELERHLDAKQNVFGIEKATASLPMDIFSNDNSNHASDPTGNGGTGDDEEEDLVIDIPH